MSKYLSLFLISVSSFAQNESAVDSTNEIPVESSSTDSDLPVEGAAKKPKKKADSESGSQRDIDRTGIKFGLNYASYLGSSSIEATTGLGLDGAIAFSSELAYQPVTLEFELGYRLLFLTVEDVKTHVIPFRLGTLYRMRTGKKSLWKIGVAPALEARISQQTGLDSDFSFAPSFTFVSQWEWGGFLIEPNFTINSIGSNAHYFIVALRSGFRF